ncbi:hypothetical protein D3C87_1693050 [compost metagenome]
MGIDPSGDIMDIEGSVAGVHFNTRLQADRFNGPVTGLNFHGQILRKTDVQIRLFGIDSKMNAG